MPRPAGPAAHIADVSYSYNGMSDPKNADADWAWLDFWAQPDTQIAFLESTGYFPSSTKVVDDARVQKNPYYAAATEHSSLAARRRRSRARSTGGQRSSCPISNARCWARSSRRRPST